MAAVLRLLRVVTRWDEVAWLYAAYPAPTVRALQDGDLPGALDFVGLHPPGFQLLHALQELTLPAPILWLALPALASGVAVWLFRKTPLVALVLATSPIQVLYCAEVNNYPWLALLVALGWWARENNELGWLAAAGCLAAWTHGLAGWAVGCAALTLGRDAWKVLGPMALVSVPLLGQVWGLAGEAHTFSQPELELALTLRDHAGRVGVVWLGLVPLAVLGVRQRPRVAAALAGTVALWAGLVLLRVAAPHQFPYHLAFTPPVALLVAAGASTVWRQRALWLVCALQALWLGGFDALRVRAIVTDGPRAIDRFLADADPSDALYLLRPAGLNDDDKGRFSPVLWRLRPWWSMPMAAPYPTAWDGHRHGQPRTVRGHTVYVNDAVRAELELAIQAHDTLWLAVYEHDNKPALTTELEDHYGPAERVGPDYLWILGR